MNDSIFNVESDARLLELETKYKTEKRRKKTPC